MYILMEFIQIRSYSISIIAEDAYSIIKIYTLLINDTGSLQESTPFNRCDSMHV